ncbi:FMN-binding protein MioC [Pasteurellaceae bacterium RH1A]|nr:FMN-binding protein MioC [Pasteurellaceae bacterium RH1A]
MNKICLITGSTLGGAEYVADHLVEVLGQQGFETELHNNASLADIDPQTPLIVVSSTHGAGELPDNIQPLFAQIEQGELDFSALKFGVVGLGSSDYDTFCNAVNIIEQTLQAKGATLVCPSCRIDVVNNFDNDATAEEWLPNFLANL